MQQLCENAVVSERDYERLSFMQMECFGRRRINLMKLLDRARILPCRHLPRGIVSMNSQVTLEDPISGQKTMLRLVYPFRADPVNGRISVDSVQGTALLGARVGQLVEWVSDDGSIQVRRVIKIPYQPEAAGQAE